MNNFYVLCAGGILRKPETHHLSSKSPQSGHIYSHIPRTQGSLMLASHEKYRWKAGGMDYSWGGSRSLIEEGLQAWPEFNIRKRKEEWKV